MRPFEVEAGRDRPGARRGDGVPARGLPHRTQPWQLDEPHGRASSSAACSRTRPSTSASSSTSSTATSTSTALDEVPRQLRRTVEVDRTAGEADRQDHRRVLGPDHRGRRQLQHVHVPRARGRAGAGGADRHLDHVHDPPGQAEVHGPQGPGRGRGDARRCGSSASAPRSSCGLPQEGRQAEARRGRSSRASTTSCARRSAASPHELADQYELQRIGHPFYNSRAGGGEGHLEVAKNIYYSNKDLAHMVLSLKPFGCMPSHPVRRRAVGRGRTSTRT